MINIFLIFFINQSINNAIDWQYDPNDIWQYPEQTIILGTGDCEDYAIEKYYQLRNIGVSDDDMLISYKAINGGHVVLIVDGIVLDNMRDDLYEDDGNSVYQLNASGMYFQGIRHEIGGILPKWYAIVRGEM